jgi:hypothetical protein
MVRSDPAATAGTFVLVPREGRQRAYDDPNEPFLKEALMCTSENSFLSSRGIPAPLQFRNI